MMHADAHLDGQHRLERAERFCGACYLFSIGATHLLLDKLGTLRLGLAVKKRGLEYWNFYVVAAAAFVVLSALEDEVPRAEYDSLKATLLRGPSGSGDSHFLHLWTMNGTSAVDDCAGFVNRAVSDVAPENAKQAVSSAIGTWIVWNMLGQAPGPDDGRLATALGHLLASTFFPYWGAA